MRGWGPPEQPLSWGLPHALGRAPRAGRGAHPVQTPPWGPQGLILLPACSSSSRLPAPSPRRSGVPKVPGAASRSRDHPTEPPFPSGPRQPQPPAPLTVLRRGQGQEGPQQRDGPVHPHAPAALFSPPCAQAPGRGEGSGGGGIRRGLLCIAPPRGTALAGLRVGTCVHVCACVCTRVSVRPRASSRPGHTLQDMAPTRQEGARGRLGPLWGARGSFSPCPVAATAPRSWHCGARAGCWVQPGAGT